MRSLRGKLIFAEPHLIDAGFDVGDVALNSCSVCHFFLSPRMPAHHARAKTVLSGRPEHLFGLGITQFADTLDPDGARFAVASFDYVE